MEWAKVLSNSCLTTFKSINNQQSENKSKWRLRLGPLALERQAHTIVTKTHIRIVQLNKQFRANVGTSSIFSVFLYNSTYCIYEGTLLGHHAR